MKERLLLKTTVGKEVSSLSSFTRMLKFLDDWSTFRTWDIVWQTASKVEKEHVKKLLKLAKSHPESGGKIVTA